MTTPVRVPPTAPPSGDREPAPTAGAAPRGRRGRRAWWVLIVTLLVVRNVPWTLDNYDQAKQAYVSFEMIREGHWWLQHSPQGTPALKPPLAGWVSAGLHAAGLRWWDLAWRLPALAASLLVLTLLWREGARAWPPAGGAWAAGAYGFNLFTPRLSTLVDTNMVLTAWVFLAGWMVWDHARRQADWTRAEQVGLGAVVLGGLLTKGPVVYAFLGPGLFAGWVLGRVGGFPVRWRSWWSGWGAWLLPLAPFAGWVATACRADPAFADQVVGREFLGRFTTGAGAVHQSQSVFFYLPHLLFKWAPWSLLLALFLAARPARRWVVRGSGPALWLACWAAGGLVAMSLVPSKRPDRIYPVVPPLCLLLAVLGPEWRRQEEARAAGAEAGEAPGRVPGWRGVVGLTAAVAAVGAWVYAGGEIAHACRHHRDALARFGARVHRRAEADGWRLGLVGGQEEGLLLYLHQLRGLTPAAAAAAWERGELDALVFSERDRAELAPALGPGRWLDQSRTTSDHRYGRYYLVARPAAQPPRPPLPP